MNNFLECYEDTTASINFNINAGYSINPTIVLSNLIKQIKSNISKGKPGCCIHSSLILADRLNNKGIKPSLIITPEPTIRDGKISNDKRASILYFDEKDNNYYVANPVEDIQLFTLLGLDSSLRYDKYNKDGSLRIPKSIMGNICSENASRILASDFIERYGNGEAYVVYDIMSYADSHSLNDLLNLGFSVTSQDFKAKEAVTLS